MHVCYVLIDTTYKHGGLVICLTHRSVELLDGTCSGVIDWNASWENDRRFKLHANSVLTYLAFGFYRHLLCQPMIYNV